MGRARLAQGALATIALGVPAIGVLATGGGVAMAAPLTMSQQAAMTLNQELASYAKTLEGVRYVYGGTSRAGFDCSGLTQYVYRHYGKTIPRTAEAQFTHFRRITKLQARPGDLIFFHDSSSPSSYVYHVGVYEGGNYMVAASTGAGKVEWESYTWAGNTVTFGTITH
jgi:cell wall-associated NlpC family hydrolase